MITAIVKANILPDKAESLRKIAQILEHDFAPYEKGCEQYESFIDGLIFITIERWSDQQSLDEHLQKDHVKKYVPLMKQCIENGVFDVQFIKGGERSFIKI
ncbi:antibiotic biosynthesis monooxygenase [Gammaproteobacteria bacterium ESL0073]|nr:antibiotic biosynthesis monooxygenase [Gammaproteobacteria bacterium ESL0073]